VPGPPSSLAFSDYPYDTVADLVYGQPTPDSMVSRVYLVSAIAIVRGARFPPRTASCASPRKGLFSRQQGDVVVAQIAWEYARPIPRA
jgi:hypothetical protein